jgi:hypothetical protein
MNKKELLQEINDKINWNISIKKKYLQDLGELLLLNWRTIYTEDSKFFSSIFETIILIKMIDASNDELVYFKSLIK